MLTDAVLVERVIAGFDDAFDELYRRHATSAWRLAQAVTNNSHDAADAVSEAFARVLQAVRSGELCPMPWKPDQSTLTTYKKQITLAVDRVNRGVDIRIRL